MRPDLFKHQLGNSIMIHTALTSLGRKNMPSLLYGSSKADYNTWSYKSSVAVNSASESYKPFPSIYVVSVGCLKMKQRYFVVKFRTGWRQENVPVRMHVFHVSIKKNRFDSLLETTGFRYKKLSRNSSLVCRQEIHLVNFKTIFHNNMIDIWYMSSI